MSAFKSVWREFREFALRGSFIDVAIGILVGAGLTPVANSLIKDIVMPSLGFFIGKVEFIDMFLVLQQGQPVGPYASLSAAQKAGAITMNYGLFLNTAFSFFMIAWVAFWVVKAINRVKRKNEADGQTEESSTKVCPFCLTVVPVGAKRCPACTSHISEELTPSEI